MAHINAGKTTTTERILYNAGSTHQVGDVDKGTTVTDYLAQERDRGITITSAAVTFNWNKHQINLIDTPGHVDFTIEVERSLSVLDGAVTILDSSAGVEAQTVTVWNQAMRYKLPSVIFLNKYDKIQADYNMCMKDLVSSLGVKASLIQLPVKTSPQEFSSIIDVIHRSYISWTDPGRNNGSNFSIKPLKDVKLDQKYMEQVEKERENLVNFLTDTDEDLANHVIDCDKISDVSSDLIVKALRKATIDCKLSPVLVGSSYKYIGVQQLMDAIVNYLPSPIERQDQIKKYLLNTSIGISEENFAFIFKIMHDKRLGALSYIRVLNGSISRLQRVKSLETGKIEQIKKIYRAFADELKEIERPVYKDDIVVVTGLSESKTGDILVDQNHQYDHHQESLQPASNEFNELITDDERSERLPFQLLGRQIVVPRLSRMEPVYFCSIEAQNVSQQLKLEHALALMAREDPSFTYEMDALGITTIRGMGKLHLEVARDRIESEHGINSILGPLQISYLETIDGSATEELSVSRLINSVNNALNIKLYVRSKPSIGVWTSKMLRLDTSGENSLGRLRNDHRKAIENGLTSALMHGPSMGYPMIGCDILLLDFKANHRCSLPVISSAASQCLVNALNRCSPILLEPIMLLEVVVPREFNGLVLSDLSARRGIVLATQARCCGSVVIRAHAPLAGLSNYSEYLRITTSGRASFSMELHKYCAMSEADKRNVVVGL